MPGLDHDVHERVRIGGAEHRAGCWNKPRPKPEAEGGGYHAPQRRYRPDGSFDVVPVFIPFRMLTECRYDQKIAPEHCDGCLHLGTGQAYDADIRARGT